jgi:hypothetical protein
MMNIVFPQFSGIRCLMMPYIQGDRTSVPDDYAPYSEIIKSVFLKEGDIGFLTIDESIVTQGKPHRGQRAKYGRALHTEAGLHRPKLYAWGNPKPGWGGQANVTLEPDVRILLANNLDGSCALWDAEQVDTSEDGDIGYLSSRYPYGEAIFMKAGEVCNIGIFTPHESIPVEQDYDRQFLRIVSSGVHGREEYFTQNPLVAFG